MHENFMSMQSTVSIPSRKKRARTGGIIISTQISKTQNPNGFIKHIILASVKRRIFFLISIFNKIANNLKEKKWKKSGFYVKKK